MAQDAGGGSPYDDTWIDQATDSRLWSDWPTGPLSFPSLPPRFPVGEPLLVPVMSRRQRVVYRLLSALWLLTHAMFWGWWFQPAHVVQPVPFFLITFILGYLAFTPGYFVYLLGRMARPNPALPLPTHMRVALATSFVPSSESIEVLEHTLRAMKAQTDATADVWVLDEGAVPEVRALAAELGILYFTRHGVARYQQPVWPFKARYKAGNYNAWLDAIGYERYDILVQMDTDHAPEPDYLAHMLRPFSDPRVAYVAAPSDVSANAHQSWTVLGRTVLEAPLHGPMQMGLNNGLCPLIMGSHSAMRTTALWRIGGFQRTRAEDHHNTLRLAHFGYRGVFAPDAIAHGYAPPSFGDALRQEWQWARSVTSVLLEYFPRDGRGLPFRKWLEFAFSETWYMCYSLVVLLGLAVAPLALAMNQPWANVNYVSFLLRFELIEVSLATLLFWTRSQGWLRPATSPVITWQSTLLSLARPPLVFMAVLDAALLAITQRDVAYGITFKADHASRGLGWRMLLPYYIIVAILGGSALAYILRYHAAGPAEGYAFLALTYGACYVLLIVLVTHLHRRDTLRLDHTARLRGSRTQLAAAYLTLALFAITATIVLPVAAPDVVGASAPRAMSSAAPATPPVLGPYAYVTPTPLPSTPFFGAYDPNGHASMMRSVDVDEYFISWAPYGADQIISDVTDSELRSRFPLLTIEPWPTRIGNRSTLLRDIAAGMYTAQEDEVVAGLKAVAPQQVYIRFGHEMDQVNGPYPWATTDAPLYIEAYRQFVTYLRDHGVTTARFIWSPGHVDTDTMRYYPGDDVVDAIGDTIIVYNGWPNHPGVPLGFAQQVAPEVAIARQLKRPLIVSEAGLWSPSAAVTLSWLQQVRDAVRHTPGLIGFVYFDAPNPSIWGAARAADWSLTEPELAYLFDGHMRMTPGFNDG